MKNLLAACAALVVVLGIVSGKLWSELRSARQQVADLQGQLAEPKTSGGQAASVQAPANPAQSVGPAASPPPPAAPQLPESRPLPPPAPNAPPAAGGREVVIVPVPVRAVTPERPLGLPTLNNPLVGRTAEERRVEALAQSDRTALARATQWNTALNLTPEQLKVLNEKTIAALRSETEESLRITTVNTPVDAAGAARLKVETVGRQYETLTRIADDMAPHLTSEQRSRMVTMFDRWLATNMARARAEEQAVLAGVTAR